MNTPQQPVRLTERQRTILEMRSHGVFLKDIASSLEITIGDVLWSTQTAGELLGANTFEHLTALAIRGGHIL